MPQTRRSIPPTTKDVAPAEPGRRLIRPGLPETCATTRARAQMPPCRRPASAARHAAWCLAKKSLFWHALDGLGQARQRLLNPDSGGTVGPTIRHHFPFLHSCALSALRYGPWPPSRSDEGEDRSPAYSLSLPLPQEGTRIVPTRSASSFFRRCYVACWSGRHPDDSEAPVDTVPGIARSQGCGV
jgi:hypothetical protein